MTTILVKDNVMYGDGQMTGAYVSEYKAKKIKNYGCAIVGGAGRWASVVKFHDWVYDKLLTEEAQTTYPETMVVMPEDLVEEDFAGLILYPDGRVIEFEGGGNSFEVNQPVAIGSGSPFAMACALNDIDGVKCIETAIHLDVGTGGEIQVERFPEEEEPKTIEELQAMSKEEILAHFIGGEEEQNDNED